jgi:hypothetical protein
LAEPKGLSSDAKRAASITIAVCPSNLVCWLVFDLFDTYTRMGSPTSGRVCREWRPDR